jgi:tripartite-type tricarboxylate transporter receptor subunit TctC
MVWKSISGTLAGIVLAAFLPAGAARAQAYPDRPVTIVVPLAAGSGMDALVRLYGEKLAAALGKPVVVENKPGAALMLAATHLASSPPDGYTLAVATSSVMAINPVLYKKVNYDPQKDFAPISLYVKSPFILVVNPGLPVKSVPELIKYAKESANPVSFASTGTGTGLHLAGEYMKLRYGLNMTHVPYRSTPQSIADIVAGHTNMSFAEVGATIPLIREGKLRALAVSGLTRHPSLPDVPTFAEAANAPDFEIVSWHLLLAPAATPKPIVERLHAEMNKLMATEDMKEKITNIGLLPVGPQSFEDIQKFLGVERDRWGTLVKNLNLAGTQ